LLGVLEQAGERDDGSSLALVEVKFGVDI